MTGKFTRVLTCFSIAASLAACGGGGGGGDAPTVTAAPGTTTTAPVVVPTTTVSTPTVAAVLPDTIVTTTPAATYVAASEEQLAFNLLNTERERCGFGRLAQNAALDAAALAHAEYQLKNNVNSHFEDATAFPLGFTGVLPADRVIAKGYLAPGAVGDEFASVQGPTSKVGLGSKLMRSLLNAPYHLKSLMSGYRDIGVSVRDGADVGSPIARVVLQLDAAYKTADNQQLLASDAVKTYPCEGTTGVDNKLVNESPNPVPGRNLAANPLGSSIYVAVRDGNVLKITSATMTSVATGLPVTLRTPITSENDPNGPCTTGCFKEHQGYVVPDAALATNAKYQVSITGTNNGVAFSRTFEFSTGS